MKQFEVLFILVKRNQTPFFAFFEWNVLALLKNIFKKPLGDVLSLDRVRRVCSCRARERENNQC